MTVTERFTIPTFQASAGALLWDRRGRLLVLRPSYKDGWTLPGGMLEAEESPWEGCRREVAEECGIHVDSGHLVAVDTRPARPGRRATALRYLFDCGLLPDGQPITLQEEELDEYRFVRLRDAWELLRPAVRRRVRSALAARDAGRGCCYLEDGKPVPGVSAVPYTR